MVEAHTVGLDDWTTLANLDGGTTTHRPRKAGPAGFLLAQHPFLRHYFSGSELRARRTRRGTWNAFTDSSGGWQQVAVDLAPYAASRSRSAISYVTDPEHGGVGAFVDATRVAVGGTAVEADGFEGTRALDRRPGSDLRGARRARRRVGG